MSIRPYSAGKAATAAPDRAQVALVSWRGAVGGAETQSHLIAREFRNRGIDASIVFIEHGGPLTQRLDRDCVPWCTLGLSRGSAVLARPRRLLKALNALGPHGVILPDVGFLIAAIRTGGYRAALIGVDHGALLQLSNLSSIKQIRLHAGRGVAARFQYEHVAVSQSMRDEIERRGMRSRCTVIYNGIDLPRAYAPPSVGPGEPLTIGAAGRLIANKGFEHAIRALTGQPTRLRIAGDGPDRARLEAIAVEIGVQAQVEFLGWVHDIGSFWRSCHVGIVPSEYTESFGLAAVEAMGAARPVIGSQLPALAEVIGTSGLLVPQSDSSAIADAIKRLATEPGLLHKLALRARARTEDLFDIRTTADAYGRLLRLDTKRLTRGP